MSVDYDVLASYYDNIYVDKNEYEQECNKIVALDTKYNKSRNNKLLDLGCGTGFQTKNVSSYFTVTGIDLSESMLKKAKKMVPRGSFYQKDMFDFVMEERFGVVINLFGSIGFATNYDMMYKNLCCVWNCMESGGIYILTPWDTQETFSNNMIVNHGKAELFNYCCMESIQQIEFDKVEVEMHYLIGENYSVNYYDYRQEITLFSEAEYRAAIDQAGFELLERLSPDEFRMGAFICRK